MQKRSIDIFSEFMDFLIDQKASVALCMNGARAVADAVEVFLARGDLDGLRE
jgi:hypothetical protein